MKLKTGLAAALAVMTMACSQNAFSAAMDKAKINPQPQTGAGYTLSATMVPFTEPVVVANAFGMPGMLYTDGKVVTMDSKGNAAAWTMKDNKLVQDKTAFGGKELKVENGKELYGSGHGNFYAAPFFGLVVLNLKNGIVYDAAKHPDKNVLQAARLAVDPSGKWGLVYPSFQKDAQILDLAKLASGTAGAAKPFTPLCNMKDDSKRAGIIGEIQCATIGKTGNIYIGGQVSKTLLKTDSQAFGAVVLDKTGKVLGSYNGDGSKFGAGKMGWTHGIVELNDGFAVLDGNLRSIFFFGKDASYKGQIDLKNLLGLDYCWPSSLQRLDKDTFLLMTTQEFKKGDKGEYEAILWKIKGM